MHVKLSVACSTYEYIFHSKLCTWFVPYNHHIQGNMSINDRDVPGNMSINDVPENMSNNDVPGNMSINGAPGNMSI